MILSITNTILAVGSLFFSIYVFVKNKLYSKTSVEVSILNAISQATNDAAKSLENLSIFQHDPSPLGETIRQNATSSLDSVLLAYDYACSKYYKQAVSLEWFRSTYTTRIRILFKTPIYQELLADENSYPYLRRFYSENQVK